MAIPKKIEKSFKDVVDYICTSYFQISYFSIFWGLLYSMFLPGLMKAVMFHSLKINSFCSWVGYCWVCLPRTRTETRSQTSCGKCRTTVFCITPRAWVKQWSKCIVPKERALDCFGNGWKLLTPGSGWVFIVQMTKIYVGPRVSHFYARSLLTFTNAIANKHTHTIIKKVQGDVSQLCLLAYKPTNYSHILH